jgi:hypothetical protein
MIVFVNDQFGYELREPHDFRRFSVGISASRDCFDKFCEALSMIEFEDDKTAWVSADELRGLAAIREDVKWHSDFDRMVEAARPHGWIRTQPKLAIKAHVVWTDADPVVGKKKD